MWGHSHTDRSCPKFGKAKDHEEPIHPVDQKKLFSDLESQGMKFTSYGAWDNGKMGGEQEREKGGVLPASFIDDFFLQENTMTWSTLPMRSLTIF